MAVLLGAAILGWLSFRSVFPFLAANRPIKSDALVVEGWLPDYAMADVRSEFEQGGYKLLIVTGGPLIKGEILAEYRTFAELTKAALLKAGFDETKLVAVPNDERFKDRTYASAVALRKWFSQSGSNFPAINVFTRGAHARRTWLLFEKALQGQAKIGIIAGKDLRYEGERWWRTSEGVRDVLDEAVAYLYARFLFHPP